MGLGPFVNHLVNAPLRFNQDGDSPIGIHVNVNVEVWPALAAPGGIGLLKVPAYPVSVGFSGGLESFTEGATSEFVGVNWLKYDWHNKKPLISQRSYRYPLPPFFWAIASS